MPVLTLFRDGQAIQMLDEAVAYAWFAQQILKNPQYVAQMTGIEQLAYLRDLNPPQPSPTIDELGRLYLDHAKISANWRAKSKSFWAEFTELVQTKQYAS